MKKFAFIALLSMVCLTVSARGKQPIAFDALPQIVQEEIHKNFETEQIQFITSEKGIGRHYHYTFSIDDGTKIELDEKAGLIGVSNKMGIDSVFVPAKIKEYVQKTFPNATITEYKYETMKQEVELNNKLDLIFDKRSAFIRIDD